jgi:hypothetical protein
VQVCKNCNKEWDSKAVNCPKCVTREAQSARIGQGKRRTERAKKFATSARRKGQGVKCNFAEGTERTRK